MPRRRYSRTYAAERQAEVRTQGPTKTGHGLCGWHPAPASARAELKRGDVVGVIFDLPDGDNVFRTVEFGYYSGNYVIGRIYDMYYKYNRDLPDDEPRWVCSTQVGGATPRERFSLCNSDYCDRCFDPRATECGHKFVRLERAEKHRRGGWFNCDGAKCVPLPDGTPVTFRRSAIRDIYNDTKNGQQLHAKYCKD